jgi:hypothetical protein
MGESIVNRLGDPWTVASPGISLKPFPSGSLTHPAMTEMLRLIDKHKFSAAQRKWMWAQTAICPML